MLHTLKPLTPLPRARPAFFSRLKSTLVTSKRLRSNLPNFHDLDGYLTHARSRELKTNSTVFNGTSYELACKETLQLCLGDVDLLHVGGGNDNGIDIYGNWRLDKFIDTQLRQTKLQDTRFQGSSITPVAFRPEKTLNLIVQCKNYSKKITAKEIRELSGIFHAEFPNDVRNQSIVLFCAPSVMTKKGVEQLNASNVPIGYFQISKMIQVKAGDQYSICNYHGGVIQAFYANPLLEALLSGSSFIEYTKASCEC